MSELSPPIIMHIFIVEICLPSGFFLITFIVLRGYLLTCNLLKNLDLMDKNSSFYNFKHVKTGSNAKFESKFILKIFRKYFFAYFQFLLIGHMRMIIKCVHITSPPVELRTLVAKLHKKNNNIYMHPIRNIQEDLHK